MNCLNLLILIILFNEIPYCDNKFANIGCYTNAYILIKSYLCDNQQQVVYNDRTSDSLLCTTEPSTKSAKIIEVNVICNIADVKFCLTDFQTPQSQPISPGPSATLLLSHSTGPHHL